MWHASVRMADMKQAKLAAENALSGVGEPAVGEWVEMHTAYHIRRRLKFREQLEFGVSLLDIRGSEEAKKRALNIMRVVPNIRQIALAEIMDAPQSISPACASRGVP